MYPLVDSIRSGDPDNIEARAAAKYWKILFGKDFVRIHAADGINSWLNYGYSILRATVARSVVAGGLHPSIGIWHANQYNYFNLVDDLIEPFRPLVDDIVKGFSLVYTDTILTTDMKKQLLSTLTYDLPYRGRMENISSIMTGYIASFRDGLVDSEKLDIPDIAKFLQNIEK
jgi:CRISPR-associated protein Cas1